MKWSSRLCTGLGLSVCAMCAGCGEPVVFKPISSPKVGKVHTPPVGMIVRTFAGHTTSQSDRFAGCRAQAVAVVTSGREMGHGRCRFVFFVDGFVVQIDLPLEGPLDAGRAELQGKAWDPRGFTIDWTATLDGDIIEGTFKQPYDHGVFRLREVK